MKTRYSSIEQGDFQGANRLSRGAVGQSGQGASSLLFEKELVEVCSEIAGVLLLGYSEGRGGQVMRRKVVDGLQERLACRLHQAEALVDLALELIHLEAYREPRQDWVELSFLIAKGGGDLGDVSSN